MNARIIGLQMLKRGYSRGYAAGVISYGSLLAPIIPPGIGFILYGTVGQVSIGRLFAAGIIPGLLIWLALAVTISITAHRRGYRPERETRPSVGEVARASWGGIWAILFPVILLLGLRYGIGHDHSQGTWGNARRTPREPRSGCAVIWGRHSHTSPARTPRRGGRCFSAC